MSFNDALKNSVLEGFSTDISTTKIFVTLGFSLLIGIYIFFVYRIKTKSSFYSKDFNVVLAGLPIITTGIVLAMQSSIVISLGMVGALSIVRFRNAVKNSMDLLFLFWSISIGIICGAGIYEIAIILSIVLTIVLLSFDYIPTRNGSLLLVVNADDINIENKLNKILKQYSKNYVIKSRSISKNNIDLIIELRSKEEKKIISELSKEEHILNVNLLSHDGERRF